MSATIEESGTRKIIEEIEEIKTKLSNETEDTIRKDLSREIINLFLALRKRVADPKYVPIDLRNIKNMNLSDAILKGARLEGAWLEGAHLTGAHLEYAILYEAHLEGARLEGAHLTGAVLKGARLEGAHLERAILKGAHLEYAILYEAHLEGARLEGAHLTGAVLKGARLEGADLTGADLTGAHLQRAILTGAILTGAILTGADLTGAVGANLEGVIGLNAPTAPRQGIAFEIHNAFDKFKAIEPEYLRLIQQPEFEGDIYEFIEKIFKDNITPELFPDDAEDKKKKFDTVFTKMGKSIPDKNNQLIAKSVSFAFAQDDNFKQQYIINFLDETCNAYSGSGDNTSCVKGIIERFVLCVGNAVQNMCSDGCENETYKELDKLMNPKFDIAATASTWWETEVTKEYIKAMSEEDRKTNFIQYLIQKAKTADVYNDSIDKDIREYTETFDKANVMAFAKLELGGKNTSKTTSMKSRKTKKAKKSKKSKKAKKSKKSKKSRKLENRKSSSKSRRLKR